jgi:hypothetical protein
VRRMENTSPREREGGISSLGRSSSSKVRIYRFRGNCSVTHPRAVQSHKLKCSQPTNSSATGSIQPGTTSAPSIRSPASAVRMRISDRER